MLTALMNNTNAKKIERKKKKRLRNSRFAAVHRAQQKSVQFEEIEILLERIRCVFADK